MLSIAILTTLLVILILAGYFYVHNAYSYWERRGIPYLQPTFPFGTFANSFFQRKSIAEDLKDAYNSASSPVLGLYSGLRPSLLIRDPKLVQTVLVKEFAGFYHRGLHANEGVDPMAANLFMQNGEKWRASRKMLSPAFTSGRIRGMFDGIVKCADSLHAHIAKFADAGKTIEIREVFACYTTNVIASVAFGLDIDCIVSPEHEFRKYGGEFFETSIRKTLRTVVNMMSPTLSRLLGLRFADKHLAEFMTALVVQNLEYRE